MDFLTSNLPLVLLFVVSGALLIWQFAQPGGKGIGPNEVSLMINREDAFVLDVREPAEFAAAHIAGARNIPLSKLPENGPELEKYKGHPVVVCCAAGGRSATAGALLRKKGFEKVFNLSGGMEAWASAGMPVKKGQK